MYRLVISYGHPSDPALFDEYYRNTHLELAGRIPGVQSFVAGHCESLDGSPPEAYFQAEIVFTSRESAESALASPTGRAAAGDIANFASGGATMVFRADEITAG